MMRMSGTMLSLMKKMRVEKRAGAMKMTIPLMLEGLRTLMM